MQPPNKLLRPATLAALFLALPLGLQAQEEFFEFEDEELEEEPVVVYENFVEIGVGYQDDGTRHFGRDSGLISEGFTPLLDFRLQHRPDWDGGSTDYWRFEGHRIGWDSRRLEIEFGQQGTQSIGLSWREMPRHRVEGALTPFNGVGTSFLGLPPDWEVTGNTTADMPRLADSLQAVNLKTRRQRLDLGYWRSITDRLSFNVDVRRETKEGLSRVGGLFGFTGGNPRTAQLPAPVDYLTEIVDATLEFSGDNYVIGGGYHGSFFENEQNSLTWQNPFGRHPQWVEGTGFPDGIGRLTLPPDNHFHQFRAFGAWTFNPRTRFNADVAVGRMEQDDGLLPFTVNPRIGADVPVPIEDASGRIDTTLLNLRLTTRPVNRMNLAFTYRFDDRDNESDQAAFRLVGGDAEMQKPPENARINLPYSFREQIVKADATWRVARRSNLVGGIQYMVQDREDFSEVADLDEWAAWAGFRTSFRPDLSFHANIRYADREFDEYDSRAPFVASHVPGTLGPDEFENHPNLRKFNMSDRERTQVRGRFDYTPIDVFALGLSASYHKDDFDDERFGLNEATAASWSFDAGYFPVAGVNLTAFYTLDRYTAEQSGRDFRGFAPQEAFDPNRNWFVDHDDDVDTFGASLELSDIARRWNAITATGLNGRLDLGFDVLFMRTRSEIDVTTGPGLSAEPLPDLVNKLNAYKAWARYQFRPDWHIRMGVEHERFSSRDFAFDGVDVDTLANVLLFGQSSPNYDVTWVTLSLGYRF